MLRFLKSLFAWKTIKFEGVYRYDENCVTGARRALRTCQGGHSPVDLDWLDAGIGHPTIDGKPAWRTAVGQADGRYCF
jgi:hypothetical protein